MTMSSIISAVAIASGVRSGDISAVEVAEQSLDRIAAIDPRFNAFCVTLPAAALEAAKEIDRRRRAGEPLGPLAGVPVAVKDFTPTAGITTTYGSMAHEHHVPDRDAVIVRRLRDAGAILVGKTTTPEFASSWFTRSLNFGETLNPWNPAHTCGGSSGGSAVAVATGCVPLAEGCDMLGSVRGPAAFCGVVGLKPALGRIPFDALRSTFDDISHFGPLARSVDDAGLFLQATSGPDRVDLNSFIPPLDLAERSGPLKIRLSLDLGYCVVHTEVREALVRAAENLAASGAEVREVNLDLTAEDAECVGNASMVWMAAHYGDLADREPEKLSPLTLKMIAIGRQARAADIKYIDFVRARLWKRLSDVFEDSDVLMCPTMAQPAPLKDGDDFDFGTRDLDGRLQALDLTSLFNLVGACPAISVPCGMTSSGLPIGAQFIAPPHDEARVFKAAHLLERLMPFPAWTDRATF